MNCFFDAPPYSFFFNLCSQFPNYGKKRIKRIIKKSSDYDKVFSLF